MSRSAPVSRLLVKIEEGAKKKKKKKVVGGKKNVLREEFGFWTWDKKWRGKEQWLKDGHSEARTHDLGLIGPTL